ncbi:hypothetical protein ACP275_14G295700 [Erythranthe tilingii]
MAESNNRGGNNVTVVLKTDFHCDGCTYKSINYIRSFDGVEAVTVGEEQKITIVGLVDPAKLRANLEKKIRKTVELVSPQPKKGGDSKHNTNGKDNRDGGNEKENKPKGQNSNDGVQKKSKKKEPPVTTAVLKLHLHCDGCIKKMYKIVTKTKGYTDMKIDMQNGLVTVIGDMDMKALAETLQKKMRKNVEIVQETDKMEKESDKGKNGVADKVKTGISRDKGKTGGDDKGKIGSGSGVDKVKTGSVRDKGKTGGDDKGKTGGGSGSVIVKTGSGRDKVKTDDKGKTGGGSSSDKVKTASGRDKGKTDDKGKTGGGSSSDKVKTASGRDKGKTGDGGAVKVKTGSGRVKSKTGRDGGDAKTMEEQSQLVENPYPVMSGPGVFGGDHAPQMFSDENPNHYCTVM